MNAGSFCNCITVTAVTDICCYILESNSRKIYIGCTHNLARRIRQHNQEITGVSKYTRKYGPWKIIYIIRNFPDFRTALSFEWHWQRYPKTRRKIKNKNKAKERAIELITGRFVSYNLRLNYIT